MQDKKQKEEDDAHAMMIEQQHLKKLEDERLAIEELSRLETEEHKLRPWKSNHENTLVESLKEMNEEQDWIKYSFCEEGYINVRKECDLNGFIYDFKERCDSVFNKF